MWTLLISTALAFDQGPWQRALDAYVDAEGRVDYAGIQAVQALDAHIESLATAEEPLKRAEKIAFWLNAYNALTVDLVADNPSIQSIRDLDGGKVWDTRAFVVAGRPMTLNQIEHQVLRPMGDPRVHAALNCASKGCPPLYKEAYTAASLDRQLQESARRWLQANGIQVDVAARSVKLSRIFEWYGDDFVGMNHKDIPGLSGKQEAAIDFAIRYVPAEQAEFLTKGGYAVTWLEYDWGLNRR